MYVRLIHHNTNNVKKPEIPYIIGSMIDAYIQYHPINKHYRLIIVKNKGKAEIWDGRKK